MTDTFRALCAELLQAWDDLPWEYDWKGNPVGPLAEIDDTPFDRAREALAQPEPDGLRPSDDDIYGLFDWLKDEWHSNNEGEFPLPEFARAVLARYGRSTITPIPVSERLPGAEDCDAEGQVWAWRWYDPENDDNGDFWTLISAEWLGKWPFWTHWLPAHALPLP